MKRMDPSFSEKSLGFKSFSDFLRSRSDVVELDESFDDADGAASCARVKPTRHRRRN